MSPWALVPVMLSAHIAADNIMRSVGYLLLVSAVSLLKIEASLTQELSAEDRACIVSAVAKLPNVPALKIERSRALPQSQSQGRRTSEKVRPISSIAFAMVK